MVDSSIIEKCRLGDFTNFRILVSAASPYAFRIAFRMIGDEEQAKEIVQETMVVIWMKINRIKNPEVFKTWLYRIVINKCYDYLRKKKRCPEERMDDKAWKILGEKLNTGNFDKLEQKESVLVINKLSEKLSSKQKAVFILCDLEEMDNEEVGRITGMSVVNIKANLHFARKRIREMLEKYL